MNTIYKYNLQVEAELADMAQTPMGFPTPGTDVPIRTLDGPVVKFGLDPQGFPCVWVMGDSEAPMINRSILVAFTGKEIPANASYIEMFHIDQYVFHVLDVRAP